MRTQAATRIRQMWSLQGRYGILHATWFAFFMSFVVWFNFAPFSSTIGEALNLSDTQLTTIALCNVALTVPARVLIGMALDRWGPRRVYAAILIYAFVPCTIFALATSFEMMVAARLALSIVGAGFVVGIRLVAEWFPPQQIGAAEGVYGGWGNFGSAAAAFTLPTVAAIVGGADGWRWAIGVTGVMALLYGLVFVRLVTDTPDGRPYARPKRQGALEVTSRAGVAGLIVVSAPLLGVLALLAWRLLRVDVLSAGAAWAIGVALAVIFVLQVRGILVVNRPARNDAYPREDRYPFRSVTILCAAYFVTFGSELAVVSMLPTFFGESFGLSAVVAGMTASAYAFMNLFSRPAGGIFSDLLGSRRRTLLALLIGLSAGYGLMAIITPGWPVALAVAAAMLCSFFVQAGEGAVFAIVPLVKHRVGGQIAGLVGAYGNVGSVCYLTLLLFAGTSAFFAAIGLSAVIAAVACRWLPEPEHSFAEQHVMERVTVTEAAVAPASA
jgi:NNP family nitrate/nitrite transporter-like MFS transporter